MNDTDFPVIGEYDVLVAGGGIAGVGVACAAARAGARTLLVERLEILGGLGTSGGVGNFCYGDNSLPQGQGPVFQDIWERLSRFGAIGEEHGWSVKHSPPFFNHPFDHQVLPIVLQEMLESAGAHLLFATDVIGAEVRDGVVHGAILHNRSLTQRARAGIFIDCTGDGILARHAGAIALTDDMEHFQSIPPGYMFFLQRSETKQAMVVNDEESEAPIANSVWKEPLRVGVKMKWPGASFDTATGQGYSDAGRAFRRRLPAFIHHYQQTTGESCQFDFAAPMFGARDGVRVEGDYILTVEDLRTARRFPDAVAHGCFPLDSAMLQDEALPPCQIPYRSLLVKGL